MNESKQGWEKELEDMECRGNRCWHETSEKHYIVDKAFIEQTIREEKEDFKRAFYKTFSGAGELWFPYSNELTKQEQDAAVDNYWQNLLFFLDNVNKEVDKQ